MHPLEKKILHGMRAQGLIPAGVTVVVAVSGGADSMALLHLLERLADMLAIRLVCARLDHGLRPAETEAEERLVRQAASRLRLEYIGAAVDAALFARQEKLSPEDAARILRYRFLVETMTARGAHLIATGHNADDQAEEVLLRLLRGSGLKGLAGMAARSGAVVRPLLAVDRREIIAYLDDRGIPHLEDSSNSCCRFPRNRVRHELLPFLERHFNPAIRRTLCATATILADEEELLDDLCARIWEQAASAAPEGSLTLAVTLLENQHAALQRRVMEKACWHMASRPGARQIAALVRLLDRKRRGRRLHLASGLRVTRVEDRLVFSFPLGRFPYRGDGPPAGDDGTQPRME